MSVEYLRQGTIVELKSPLLRNSFRINGVSLAGILIDTTEEATLLI